jgi:hypothetical protein
MSRHYGNAPPRLAVPTSRNLIERMFGRLEDRHRIAAATTRSHATSSQQSNSPQPSSGGPD